MKVSIGHFFGKCLWLFLFFCICLNGHVVNGQTGPILYFLHDMYEVTEGDMNGETKANLTVCQAPNTFQSSASFAFSDGFALSGSDYTATMGSTLLQANVSCTDLQIDITSDNVAEGTEEFTIQLQPALPARVAGFNAAATVTIYDDDNMYTVNFRQISYSVPEGMGSVDLEVCLSPQSPGSFGSVTTFPGTAGVGDADFFPITSLELVFQSGFPCTVVPVIIFEDAIAEADESFTVRLTAVPPAQVQQGYNVATVTILDDDTAPVNTAPELSGCPAGTVADFTTTPSCNDAQDGAPVVTCNPPAGSTFQAGITTSVSCSCTDSAGLSSNCMFDVFAPVNTAPELLGCPVGTVNNFTTSPRCNDAEDSAPMVTCNPPAGNNFQAGMTTSVACSCADNAGSTSNCTFNVFAPKITCPVSSLVFNVDPDEQDTTVNIDSMVTCEGGTLFCGTQSKFPVGSHTVDCFCFSGTTNDMCSVTVEIKAPVLNMEPTLFGCPVGTVNSFTATPNCNDAEDGDLDVTCNPPAGYNFQAGTTTPVSCFCRDSGTATDVCTFSVVVATYLATELETRLIDMINTISGENTTTEEVVMASEAIAELSDNEDFLEENPQRIELVISSLESVMRAGEASINVTDPAVRTINNLMNLDLDILEDGMIEGGRAVAALEGQITNFHTSDGNFSTVLDNVGVTAVKIDARSVGSSLAYANVFPKNEIPLYDGALQEGNTRLFSDGDAIPLNRTATSISVPTTVLELLGEAGVELTAVPVTFIIYGNDVLFRPSMPTEVEEYIKEEDNSTVTERVASQIISAIIRTENTSIVKLPPGSPVITTFVSNLTITVNETIEAHDCVVWSYNENTGEGFWTKDGCERMSHDNRGLTMCSCDRLGSFAVLIRVRKGRVEAQVALYYITLIGSIISGLALIGCLIIFVSLKSFRSKQPTHIHINLCLSLLGFYIAFLLSPLAIGKEIRCTVASVFIHFFALATLAWMSAEAMNMYYLFLKAARSTVRHFIPIACLLAYGLPAVCALLVVFLDNSTDFQSASYCFIHPGYALYFGFLTEVGAMFVFNFIIFIWLICKILCRPLMVSKTAENAKRNEIIKRVRHAILFWFILGLSWIFGFFAAVDTTTLIFDYLYCFSISIQGILMFILLCVANPAFRGIFKKKDFMRTKVTTQTTTKNLTSSQLVSRSQYEIPMDSIDNPSTFATE